MNSEPGRARLKLWHQRVPNALSAHLFSGALCTALWCTRFGEGVNFTEVSLVHGNGGAR